MGYDNPEAIGKENCRYDVCIQLPKDKKQNSLHGKFDHKVIKGGKYAIFICRAPLNKMSDVIKDAFDRIFFKWFPDSKENYDIYRMCYMEHWGETTKIYIPLI